ncbi:hypothetical protein HYX11_03290 [Candidatus Woesearchaeota archaeon]|nr:hypothetical protein [Candidatus Woesearchaeota archaeon]
MVNKEELMKTKSLEEAIGLLFNRVSNGRNCMSKKTDHHQSIDWWHARLRARVGFLTMLFPL